jgi:hypothetical protein
VNKKPPTEVRGNNQGASTIPFFRYPSAHPEKLGKSVVLDACWWAGKRFCIRNDSMKLPSFVFNRDVASDF